MMMKKYKILKDFSGSQDGSLVEFFKKGDVVDLSDELAAVVVPEKWAKRVTVKRKK